jgi:hypothetical protein
MADRTDNMLTILRALVAQHCAAALKAREAGDVELSEQLVARAIYYEEQANALETGQ